jgi:hypothetical protein
MVAQRVLLHLAARRHADGVEAFDDGEMARHPEIGAALAQELHQLGLGRRRVGLERDEGRAHLAQPRIGHADDLRRGDRGMREQHLLDLGRGDVLAADTEYVLAAADHAQAAVGGEHADVAGTQPAVGRERLCRLLRVLVVAAHHVPAAHLDLAGLAGMEHRAGVALGDAHLDAVVRLGEPRDAQLGWVAVVVEHHVG